MPDSLPNRPGAQCGFSIIPRDAHHWDIHTERGRSFRIRGTPGDVIVHDEREIKTLSPLPGQPIRPHRFKTVTTAMAWIIDEMMTSPFRAEHLDIETEGA